MNLTKNFTFDELTKTSNAGLQDLNRAKAKIYTGTLTMVAEDLERLRAYLGSPIEVHSAFRCPELNGATPGSSPKSQHMRGEAADFSCPGKFQETDDGNKALFEAIRDYLKTRTMSFGQLIDEGCNRPYGRVVWIHYSLGSPMRDHDKCGQLLRMRDGKFESLGAVAQP